ncbi:hypothetical protein PIB30_003797 [Stylosanthes scabra]|uniref:beta-galactosidase n=1 Tax=Stylosanthes scabra TaxID=79078 RepID=A0ABU6S2X0_9FABA|nr:hypothetical protein [Stylosanthes scabra]
MPYNFEGRYDLVKFAKLVASKGLYFFLRIGPYACAEWNFGDGAIVSKVVNIMRDENLFSLQGGLIILLQVGIEYGLYGVWPFYA